MLGYDRKEEAIREARVISRNIAMDFLETVEDPSVHTAKSPLQSVLLLPSGPKRLNLYEIASPKQIKRKTFGPNEVSY